MFLKNCKIETRCNILDLITTILVANWILYWTHNFVRFYNNLFHSGRKWNIYEINEQSGFYLPDTQSVKSCSIYRICRKCNNKYYSTFYLQEDWRKHAKKENLWKLFWHSWDAKGHIDVYWYAHLSLAHPYVYTSSFLSRLVDSRGTRRCSD